MIIEEKKYGIQEVFDMIGEENLNGNTVQRVCRPNIVVDGFNVYSKSLRYMTFCQKGLKCVCCGKEGTHFKLCGENGSNRRHFNLYADDGTLMTKDHIVPASKGGPDHVDNMQTMCTYCNKEKGNTSDVKKEYIVGRKGDKEIQFSTIEKAAYKVAVDLGKATSKKHSKEDAVRCGISSALKLMAAINNEIKYGGYTWTIKMR